MIAYDLIKVLACLLEPFDHIHDLSVQLATFRVENDAGVVGGYVSLLNVTIRMTNRRIKKNNEEKH